MFYLDLYTYPNIEGVEIWYPCRIYMVGCCSYRLPWSGELSLLSLFFFFFFLRVVNPNLVIAALRDCIFFLLWRVMMRNAFQNSLRWQRKQGVLRSNTVEGTLNFIVTGPKQSNCSERAVLKLICLSVFVVLLYTQVLI